MRLPNVSMSCAASVRRSGGRPDATDPTQACPGRQQVTRGGIGGDAPIELEERRAHRRSAAAPVVRTPQSSQRPDSPRHRPLHAMRGDRHHGRRAERRQTAGGWDPLASPSPPGRPTSIPRSPSVRPSRWAGGRHPAPRAAVRPRAPIRRHGRSCMRRRAPPPPPRVDDPCRYRERRRPARPRRSPEQPPARPDRTLVARPRPQMMPRTRAAYAALTATRRRVCRTRHRARRRPGRTTRSPGPDRSRCRNRTTCPCRPRRPTRMRPTWHTCSRYRGR